MSKGYKYFKICIYIAAVILLSAADQITKAFAAGLKGTYGIAVISDVFEFYYLENTGTAWGMFEGARVIFLILTCIVVAFVTYTIIVMPVCKKYMPLYVSLILISAGGIGNFIDRLFLGYVRDFLYFKLIDFPVFNVADSYVTIGIILLIILVLFAYEESDFDFYHRDSNKTTQIKKR